MCLGTVLFARPIVFLTCTKASLLCCSICSRCVILQSAQRATLAADPCTCSQVHTHDITQLSSPGVGRSGQCEIQLLCRQARPMWMPEPLQCRLPGSSCSRQCATTPSCVAQLGIHSSRVHTCTDDGKVHCWSLQSARLSCNAAQTLYAVIQCVPEHGL